MAADTGVDEETVLGAKTGIETGLAVTTSVHRTDNFPAMELTQFT